MQNYYWLKLHFDMLDDWKVGTLPDGLKWRFIQCLLVAGELQEGGWLPPLNQFAFRIRPMTPEQLQADLSRLAAAELVELRLYDDDSERWFVSKFQKRQERKSGKERQKAWRDRQRNEDDTQSLRDNNDSVTTRYADIDIDIDKSREDKEVELAASLATIAKETLAPGFNEQKYNSAIGVLMKREATTNDIEAFGDWWEHNGWHTDRPALKNILDHWPDYLAGRCLRKVNGQESIDDRKKRIEALIEAGK